MCAYPSTGQKRVDDKQCGEDEYELIADFELREIGPCHIEQNAGRDHEDHLGQGR